MIPTAGRATLPLESAKGMRQSLSHVYLAISHKPFETDYTMYFQAKNGKTDHAHKAFQANNGEHRVPRAGRAGLKT